MTNAFNLSQLANNTNSSGQVTLTTGVVGTLPVANGGTGVATSTGSGANVLSTSPTLVTPLLGTPTSGNLANCTGIPAPAALSTASGSAPSYSARAWVNFNGTGTVAIRASGNVSSITDNNPNDYTINFTTNMPNVDYSLMVSSQAPTDNNDPNTPNIFNSKAGAANYGSVAPTVSAARFVTPNSSGAASTDPTYICAIVFR